MTTILEPSALTSVAEFHQTFKVPIVQSGPCIPNPERAQLRVALLQEELNEFKAAIKEGDMVECADALADLQYVLSGAVLEFGMQDQFKALFDEVHRSNMTKACATRAEAEQTVAHYKEKTGVESTIESRDGGEGFVVYRAKDRKVLKSVNYSPASLRSVLVSRALPSPARACAAAVTLETKSRPVEKRPCEESSLKGSKEDFGKRPRCAGGEAQAKRTDVVVVVGPSGVGKSCLVDRLMAEYPGRFGYSVSHTTRMPRPGEQDGIDYKFTSIEAMRHEIALGKFIEHAEVHGNLYGTSYEAVEEVVAEGKVCFLIIDVQGSEIVKKGPLHTRSTYIFIAPPDAEELERRLRSRGTETEEKIQMRLQNAKKELAYLDRRGFWDAVLMNTELDACYAKFRGFVEDAVGGPKYFEPNRTEQEGQEVNLHKRL